MHGTKHAWGVEQESQSYIGKRGTTMVTHGRPFMHALEGTTMRGQVGGTREGDREGAGAGAGGRASEWVGGQVGGRVTLTMSRKGVPSSECPNCVGYLERVSAKPS